MGVYRMKSPCGVRLGWTCHIGTFVDRQTATAETITFQQIMCANSMWKRTTRLSRGQQVTHQRSISRNMYECVNKTSHSSGFETQGRYNEKSKTGVSMAPRKKIMQTVNRIFFFGFNCATVGSLLSLDPLQTLIKMVKTDKNVKRKKTH